MLAKPNAKNKVLNSKILHNKLKTHDSKLTIHNYSAWQLTGLILLIVKGPETISEI